MKNDITVVEQLPQGSNIFFKEPSDGQAYANKLEKAIISVTGKFEVIKEVSKRFKRIVVELKTGETSLTRKLKPLKSFAELQSRVEAWNPDFKCVLTIPNTCEIIGSQEELIFAYEDVSSESDILTLELKLYAKSEKRKFDCLEEPECQGINHSGKWMPSEEVLFKAGVQQCGWGNWKRIAEVVNTRTMDQIKAFSKTQAGKSVKIELNFIPTQSKLADGLFEASNSVSRVLENQENTVFGKNDEK